MEENTIMIEILYFAQLKEIVEKDKETLDLKEIKVRELLNWLTNKYHPFKEILLDNKNNKLKNYISIAINHQVIHEQDILSTKLHEGDTIAFLLPVSGG